MPENINNFDFWVIAFPHDRVIGDSQVRSTMYHLGVLSLYTQNYVGIGFFSSLFSPLPNKNALHELFQGQFVATLQGQSPFSVANQVTRPRGGNIQVTPFDTAVNQAIWDLQGKILNMPLYRLLGGTRNRIPAYASPLDFHLTEEQLRDILAQAKRMGFTRFKIKVGHPDREWDIARLKFVQSVVGQDAVLMADANEAWSPKEAVRRLHAFRDAGVTLYWIEDPCLRDDFDGLTLIQQAAPFTLVNAGEYLDVHGKRQLIASRSVDILNIHGHISDGLRVGWLAADHGIPVSLGNTIFEVGIHLACALPEVIGLEYSLWNYHHLLKAPVQFEDGFAIVPDRPGHGLELAPVDM